MRPLSVLVPEVPTIPALDLSEKDFPRDREARMGKGATLQHVEGVEGAGDDPLGVLGFEGAASFEEHQQLDDQQPRHEADGRVYGHSVGPRLLRRLRLLRHGATSLRPGVTLKRGLAADPATGRQLSRRRVRRGPVRGRELSSFAGNARRLVVVGRIESVLCRFQSRCDHARDQTARDRPDVLEASVVSPRVTALHAQQHRRSAWKVLSRNTREKVAEHET